MVRRARAPERETKMRVEEIGAALDDVLEAVGGDLETIGAVNPQLKAAIQNAQAAAGGGSKKSAMRRRAIRGDTSEGEPVNTFLPLTNGSGALAAAGTVALTGTPQRNFMPEQLIVMADGIAVTVTSITIASIPMLAASTGDVPSKCFSHDVVLPFPIDWRVIPAQQSIIVNAKNNHASAASAVYGSVYGEYTI
jgi:hypothetical protein